MAENENDDRPQPVDRAKQESEPENSSPPKSSAGKTSKDSMTERLEWLRKHGGTVIESPENGRNVAIIGVSVRRKMRQNQRDRQRGQPKSKH